VRLRFAGGSAEQGRTCFALSGDFGTVLVDCGVARVFRQGAAGEYPLLDPRELRQPVSVLLSHAHEDHCAGLPWLAAQGVRLAIRCHPLTAALVPEYCRAWRSAVQRAGFEPPYSEAAIEALELDPFSPGETFSLGPFQVSSGTAGHLPGSVWYLLEGLGQRLLFTGDWCTENPLLAGPLFPEGASVIVTDAAYGLARRENSLALEALEELATRTDARSGRVLCAVPRYGRGQEMLLAHLARREASSTPLWVEQKLLAGLALYRTEGEELWPEGARLLGALASRPLQTFEDPSSIPSGPALIFATDAMLSSGSSAVLAALLLAEPESRIVLSGHQAPGTLGASLLAKNHATAVRLSWKVHPDGDDVRQLLERSPGARCFLVHSELAQALPLRDELRQSGLQAEVAAPGDEVVISEE